MYSGKRETWLRGLVTQLFSFLGEGMRVSHKGFLLGEIRVSLEEIEAKDEGSPERDDIVADIYMAIPPKPRVS